MTDNEIKRIRLWANDMIEALKRLDAVYCTKTYDDTGDTIHLKSNLVSPCSSASPLVSSGVQIYSGLRNLAEALGCEIDTEKLTEDIDKGSFVYEGVRFFQIDVETKEIISQNA